VAIPSERFRRSIGDGVVETPGIRMSENDRDVHCGLVMTRGTRRWGKQDHGSRVTSRSSSQDMSNFILLALIAASTSARVFFFDCEACRARRVAAISTIDFASDIRPARYAPPSPSRGSRPADSANRDLCQLNSSSQRVQVVLQLNGGELVLPIRQSAAQSNLKRRFAKAWILPDSFSTGTQ